MSQWDGGAAVYSLAAGRLAWCSRLPITVMAVDSRSSQLALGIWPSLMVMVDASGAPGGGLGLLHGVHLSAARFYQAQHSSDLVRLHSLEVHAQFGSAFYFGCSNMHLCCPSRYASPRGARSLIFCVMLAGVRTDGAE